MRARLRTAVVATVLALATMLGGAPAQAAAPPADTVLAVASVNGAMYAWPPTASGWSNRGGGMGSAPVVAVSGGVVHYIAVGANGYLYHRTETTGWVRLAPTTVLCQFVSALAIDGTVHLGCTGLNRALYQATFPGDAQTPYVTSLTRLGGVISGAAAPVAGPGGLEWVVRGGTYTEAGQSFNTYAFSEGAWVRDFAWCDVPPAAAGTPTSYAMACWQAARGDVPAGFYVEQWTPDGWSDYRTTGATATQSTLVTTGLATTGDQDFLLALQGTNGKVYSRVLGATGPVTGWVDHGGLVKLGAGASSLTEATLPLVPAGMTPTQVSGFDRAG